ncbi:hypothetical protein ACCQ12_00335 [Xanthomonas sp. NCPPB 1068]|uniref:hypothetical protein n=1 Tax=Xanthomonas sp. NCPPB 1068 TaxID=487525 RepID=UPI0035575A22
MAKNGTYYVGRVLKLGELNQDRLLSALSNPSILESKRGTWALVDIKIGEANKYIFGRLARYLPEGKVDVVLPHTLSTGTQIEPNLLVASAPFIYIPEHSGIAFLSNAPRIDQKTFSRIFCKIIENSLDGFFVDCDISLIADLREFAIRIASLDCIYKIKVTVSPPNPLFGPLWESLKDYLIARNADRLNLLEDARSGSSLNSILPDLASNIHVNSDYPQVSSDESVPLGDAAILMAVDGYGEGSIKGKSGQDTVIIRTSETNVNFDFDRDPQANDLYEIANRILEQIRADRYMEHG